MKNKLAISTLAFQGWELADAILACQNHRIDALEIRMGFHEWSKLELSDSVYREYAAQIQDCGLKVSDLGTSIRMIGYQEESLKELERNCQIAKILGCKGLRVMLGNRHKRFSDKVPNLDYPGLGNWLTKADEILDAYGTQIWVETHDEFATGKAFRTFMDPYKFRHIKSLWDIMHPLEAGELPEDTLNYIGSDLVHVHIKDGRPWEDPDLSSWKYTRIGEGDVPIREIVSLILSTGYSGYFSLEWESSWREEIRGEGYEIPKIIETFSKVMHDI